MHLVAELKRRNVIRMAGLYLVGAWLIVQVAETLLPLYDTPGWVLKVLVLLLALGFLPALVFAWVFELTPDGLKRDADVPAGKSIAPQTARRMNRMIIVALVLALGYFAIDKFAAEKGSESFVGPIASQTAAAPKPAVDPDPLSADPLSAPKPIPNKSIAVLAFADLSPGKDQEYFADGISEEILNALAKVQDLRVAGRTSAFHYKGRNEDLRSIGRALGVAHVLEGSVRKQGDQVRITAQLIRSDDGFHLWSETYPGDLKDVFELQERIARAIATELKVVLDGKEARMVPVATTDPDAYALYLRATEAFHKRDYAAMGQGIDWLRRAITLDPKFARAEARLAMLHALGNPEFGSVPLEAAAHARRAIALDPGFAEPYLALALDARRARRTRESREFLDQALALEPNDASVAFYDGQWWIVAGYTERGIERLERALELDPMLPNALNWRAQQFLLAGELDTAERMALRADSLGLSLARIVLASIAFERGEYARWRELTLPWLRAQIALCVKDPDAAAQALLIPLRFDAPGGTAALAVIEECVATQPELNRTPLILRLIALGANPRAIELMRRLASEEAAVLILVFSPMGRELRREPGFAAFAHESGLVDVWEEYGPPDACRRTAPRAYACE